MDYSQPLHGIIAIIILLVLLFITFFWGTSNRVTTNEHIPRTAASAFLFLLLTCLFIFLTANESVKMIIIFMSILSCLSFFSFAYHVVQLIMLINERKG